MKRIYYYPIVIVCVVLVVVLGYFCWFAPVTTVILLRHAERLNSTDTTSLSPEGFQRASMLAHVVGGAGIGKIFVSDKVRTAQTAAPTAAALGITPIQIPVAQTDRLVDSINAHRGKVILIVGHSDTVPAVIERLGISLPPPIVPNEFDHLFIVTLSRCKSTLMRLKYGTPS